MATQIHGETIENSLSGDYFSYTLREPVGVVGAIIPWNGPLGAVIWKIGLVLATGCTAILKPAGKAALTALRLGELFQEAGVPDGVINIVPGFGETAGAALASHRDVDKVAFTGSHLTGQKIVQASAGNLKRVSLEIGGKSPDIVFADVAEFATTLKVGYGLDPDTQIGPLVSEQQLDRITGYLAIGKDEGARPLVGGQRITDGDLAAGYFVPPTVFADGRDDMRVAQEEISGRR